MLFFTLTYPFSPPSLHILSPFPLLSLSPLSLSLLPPLPLSLLSAGLLSSVFLRGPQYVLAAVCCGGSRPPPVFSKGAYIPMWSPDTSPKYRRGILRRAVFSDEQRKELEKTFKRQKYISKTDRNKL
uniref:Homeobox domain-containing protein n=1 Tax=Hucho hucho TaxID=62062 RepID=A0A4W5N5T8_9TELE